MTFAALESYAYDNVLVIFLYDQQFFRYVHTHVNYARNLSKLTCEWIRLLLLTQRQVVYLILGGTVDIIKLIKHVVHWSIKKQYEIIRITENFLWHSVS